MRRVKFLPLSQISAKYIGTWIITEGFVETIYPIKEDRLKNYIIVDSSSPLQRGIYLSMDSTHRTYIISDGRRELTLIHAPLSLYQGQRIRMLCKVVKQGKGIALKFKKLV